MGYVGWRLNQLSMFFSDVSGLRRCGKIVAHPSKNLSTVWYPQNDGLMIFSLNLGVYFPRSLVLFPRFAGEFRSKFVPNPEKVLQHALGVHGEFLAAAYSQANVVPAPTFELSKPNLKLDCPLIIKS